MRIYRKEDFNERDFWKIFCMGFGPGETMEDVKRKQEKLLEESGVKPLAETDKAIECGDTISIHGKLYFVAVGGKSKCVVRDIDHISKFPETYEGCDHLYCPYCGEMVEDVFELPDNGTHRCEKCGSLFRFEKECIIEYNSYPVEAATIKEI